MCLVLYITGYTENVYQKKKEKELRKNGLHVSSILTENFVR